MPKALLLENIHPDAAQSLRDHGFEVECLKGALSEDELIDALEGVDLLGIRSKTSVTRKVIDARPTLTAVGCFCIGTNQVDLEYAGKNGIAVFNAPYSNTRSVVELVIGDIICLMRRIPAHTHHMKHGMWDKSASGSHEVRGKTLGIIGYGNIGSQLSVVAEALGMRVLVYDLEGTRWATPTVATRSTNCWNSPMWSRFMWMDASRTRDSSAKTSSSI